MRKKALSVMLVVIMLCCGCAQGRELAGHWYAMDEGAAYRGFPDEIMFFSNGTYSADGIMGQYTAKKNNLTLSAAGNTQQYDYTLSGGVLNVIDGAWSMRYTTDETLVEISAPAYTGQVLPEESEPLSEAEMDALVEQEVAKVAKELEKYTAAGDAEGAYRYISEQRTLLKATYTAYKLTELDELEESCRERYKNHALQQAKTEYERDGYKAAESILRKAVALLGEDEELNAALEYYQEKGPQLFTDFLNDYYYNDTHDGIWSVKTDVKDNIGTKYDKAVKLAATHINSRPATSYTYLLSGSHDTFSGRVFIDEESRSTKSSGVVRIYCDGELLWSSPVLTKGTAPVDFSIGISGHGELTIEAQVKSFVNYEHVNMYMAEGVLTDSGSDANTADTDCEDCGVKGDDNERAHAAYKELLSSRKWMDYTDADFSDITPENYSDMWVGEYSVYDIDGNGIDELSVVAGQTTMGSRRVFFTYKNGKIICLGNQLGYTVLYGIKNRQGILACEMHTGICWDSYIKIADDAISVVQTKEYGEYEAGLFRDSELTPLASYSVHDDAGL